MAERFDDLMLRDRSRPDDLEDPLHAILSQQQIEDQVEEHVAPQREAIKVFRQAEAAGSPFDQPDLAIDDEPGNDVMGSFIKGTLSKSPERIETFDEFFDKNAPARYMLTDAFRGMFDSLLGRKTRRVRDDLMETFKLKQVSEAKRDQLNQRNQQAAMTLAARIEQQRLARADRRERQIENLGHRKEVQAQLQDWRDDNMDIKGRLAAAGIDRTNALTALTQQKIDKNKRELERFSFKGSPFEAAMNILVRQVGLENIEIDDITDIVRSLRIANTKNTKTGKPSLGVDAMDAYNLVKQGAVALHNINRTFNDEDGTAGKVWQILASGEKQVILTGGDNGFNQQVAAAQGSKQAYDEFFNIAVAARFDIDPKADGTKQRILGWLQHVKGTVGQNAPARLLSVFAPAKATKFAREGGEVGVLTNEDIKRFLMMLPSTDDDEETLQLKKRLFAINYVRSVWQIAKSQDTVGSVEASKIKLNFSQATALAASRNQSLDDFFIDMIESGVSFENDESVLDVNGRPIG